MVCGEELQVVVAVVTFPSTRHPRQLLFHDHLARVDRNPQALAERLAQHYRLLDFAPRPGHERTFLHRTSTASCGGLVFSGGYTTPIQGLLQPSPEDTVASVAADFGFSSLSVFSREFRNRFGLRASDLLREGKRWIR